MSATTLAKIEVMIEDLERGEQLRLIEEVSHRLRQKENLEETVTVSRHPHRLYGILKGRVPSDFDLDQALKEIRSEWTEELEET